jgi:phage baseplate assembly protein W
MAAAHELIAAPAPLAIGATGLDGLLQCLRIIVTTLVWSVPLDRKFAATGSYIDAPLPYAVAQRLAELTEAIERYEPRVKVISLRLTDPAAKLEDLMEGRVFPVINFQVRDGVVL